MKAFNFLLYDRFYTLDLWKFTSILLTAWNIHNHPWSLCLFITTFQFQYIRVTSYPNLCVYDLQL